jgi:Uma2 family endonuclease
MATVESAPVVQYVVSPAAISGPPEGGLMWPVEHCVLHGIPWHLYWELRELPENESLRMTYDRGKLEVMTLSRRHERYARLIERLIYVWSDEQGIAIESCGSMTIRREDLERGFEPDNCYYIAHEPLLREREELDFAVDPPPDLAVEVEVSRAAVGKMPIYAAFGVPELWRYDGQKLQMFTLSGEQYQRAAQSQAIVGFPATKAEACLAELGTAGTTQLAREFREWVRRNR